MKTCEHLAPLEAALAKRGIELESIRSPYADGGRWFGCACTFNEPTLRRRLALAECVRYEEYDGRVAGSDATFACTPCGCVIMGLHPRYAKKSARRLK